MDIYHINLSPFPLARLQGTDEGNQCRLVGHTIQTRHLVNRHSAEKVRNPMTEICSTSVCFSPLLLP